MSKIRVVQVGKPGGALELVEREAPDPSLGLWPAIHPLLLEQVLARNNGREVVVVLFWRLVVRELAEEGTHLQSAVRVLVLFDGELDSESRCTASPERGKSLA
jgi:hypothetical protein